MDSQRMPRYDSSSSNFSNFSSFSNTTYIFANAENFNINANANVTKCDSESESAPASAFSASSSSASFEYLGGSPVTEGDYEIEYSAAPSHEPHAFSHNFNYNNYQNYSTHLSNNYNCNYSNSSFNGATTAASQNFSHNTASQKTNQKNAGLEGKEVEFECFRTLASQNGDVVQGMGQVERFERFPFQGQQRGVGAGAERQERLRRLVKAVAEEHQVHVLNDRKFSLTKRYKPIKVIGTGAYGVVISALDLWTNRKVAIKQVKKAFEDTIDALRVIREIKLMNHFEHPNIITLNEVMLPSASSTVNISNLAANSPKSTEEFDFEDIYIVSELMETDLYRVINSRQVLTDDHVQYFMYQILRSTYYIHSAGVLHRDLKPQNLLVNSSCDIKICDFGLARAMNNSELTEYVVTRWYRPPEILLAIRDYNEKVDVWGIGCIMAEMFGKKPLFPGQHYIDMLKIICDKLGKPKFEDTLFIPSKRGRDFIRSMPDVTPVNFSLAFPNASPMAIDLMIKMLAFDPEKRISVADALNHPYIRPLVGEEDFYVEQQFDFREEKLELNKPMLKELVLKEVAKFDGRAQEILTLREQNGQLYFPLENNLL